MDDMLPNWMSMTNSPDLPTVLVIDDSQPVRDILLALLSRSGYRVVQAADGERGIALYRDHHRDISLVLLDVQMPRKSGMTTLTELRKITPDVRCLLMTGNEHKDEVVQAEVAGVVAKPFNPSAAADGTGEGRRAAWPTGADAGGIEGQSRHSRWLSDLESEPGGTTIAVVTGRSARSVNAPSRGSHKPRRPGCGTASE